MRPKVGNKVTDIGLKPTDWHISEISELGKVRKGKGINRDAVQPFGLPCVRYGEIYTSYNYEVKATRSFISEETALSSEPINKGEILFTGSGETAEDIGKAVVYQLEEPGYAGGDILILQPYNNKIVPLFLSFQWETKGIRSQRRTSGQGASIFHLYGDALKKIQVVLPPLIEQRKITDILSTVNEHISETQSLMEKSKVLKQGMMQQLLTKGIGHTEFKDTVIGQIPVEWRIMELCQCVDRIIGGGTPSRDDTSYYDGDIPWVTVKDMNGSFYMIDSQEHITLEAISKSASNLIPEGAVIIATRMGLGRGFINQRSLAINQDLKALIPNKIILPEFLLFYLLSIAAFIESNGNGSTVKGIRLEFLREISIPVPPSQEQRKIAGILLTIDDEININNIKVNQLNRLKAALMQQLLTGKIRVNV